jgi:hypothetical protein
MARSRKIILGSSQRMILQNTLPLLKAVRKCTDVLCALFTGSKQSIFVYDALLQMRTVTSSKLVTTKLDWLSLSLQRLIS